ncbi:HelD family protein [Haloglycomyces albus]|uniref:HelD family protein n=1 Tax=Haloglycomyces albus TaxID=526067 RepID=UPI00046CAC2E|nr:ATP-binding domain-containing protein [Haloglycomyces albus]
MSSDRASAMREEQANLDALYERLDHMRTEADSGIRASRLKHVETDQELSQRDIETHMWNRRLAVLNSVEDGLVFGRLDFPREQHYLGKIGIRSASGHQQLIDWRSEAGREFYLATAANPGEVKRRRHLKVRERRITGITDEDFTGEVAASDNNIAAESALIAALNDPRGEYMRDIVATIQTEQDDIIRSPLEGITVIDGAPGTGKTAVALHRAAYLLYQHRRQLARRGVLVIGPGTDFLHYISEVLPGLAENDVLLRTPGQIFPGVSPHRTEPDEVAQLKGSRRMAGIIAAAIADREEVPNEAIRIDYHGVELYLRPEKVTAARDAARDSGHRHNNSIEVFHKRVIADLANQYAEVIGADPLGGENFLDLNDRARLAEEIARDFAIRAEISRLWPELSAFDLLEDLFASRSRLANAAATLTRRQQESLYRVPGGGWSEADVALLDEAAEQLGSRERRRLDDGFDPTLDYAEGVFSIASGSASFEFEDEEDSEILSARDLIDAGELGNRQGQDLYISVAERAAADREWIFGHVIVDEAQELSPMMWRALLRRCVTKSFTVAGDLAQSGTPAAPGNWDEVFGELNSPWRHCRLTVSYRTPAEVLEVADRVLSEIDPTAARTEAVRRSGIDPWLHIAKGDIEEAVRGLYAEAQSLGSVAVISVDELHCQEFTSVTPRQAKGLEYDTVIVVEPDRIATDPQGLRDLYVALTRATRQLGVVSTSLPLFPGAEYLVTR